MQHEILNLLLNWVDRIPSVHVGLDPLQLPFRLKYHSVLGEFTPKILKYTPWPLPHTHWCTIIARLAPVPSSSRLARSLPTPPFMPTPLCCHLNRTSDPCFGLCPSSPPWQPRSQHPGNVGEDFLPHPLSLFRTKEGSWFDLLTIELATPSPSSPRLEAGLGDVGSSVWAFIWRAMCAWGTIKRRWWRDGCLEASD